MSLKHPKDIIVNIDLTNNDQAVLNYVNLLASKFDIETIKLIHVIPSILTVENSYINIHDFMGQDLNLQEEIHGKVESLAKMIESTSSQVEIFVVVGNTYRELMSFVEDLNSDLIILGVNSDNELNQKTSKKLVRNFEGNILYVPEETQGEVKEIVVPIDFSQNSARALEFALETSKKFKGCTIRCVHVINSVPDKYYLNMNLNYNINQQLHSIAKDGWGMFLMKHDFSEEISIDFLRAANDSVYKVLGGYVEKNKPDMVVMGAQGHPAFETFFIGSVTEGLVELCPKSSLYIIR